MRSNFHFIIGLLLNFGLFGIFALNYSVENLRLSVEYRWIYETGKMTYLISLPIILLASFINSYLYLLNIEGLNVRKAFIVFFLIFPVIIFILLMINSFEQQ